MQLMNVARGGTLWQDLDSQLHTQVGHQQAAPKDQPAHEVTVVPGTRLAHLALAPGLPVNSTHHQAVKRLGHGLVASALSPDELVEALEDPSLPFFVGVQWHPESMREAPHRAIYRGLVDAARARIAATSTAGPPRVS
jgi:putative glutamine amidotransferase